MADLVYATPGQYAPYAGGIGWVNFKDIKLAVGAKISNFSATFKDGSTVLFDIASEKINNTGRPFTGAKAPTYTNAPFAITGYVTANDYIILYEDQGNYKSVSTRLIIDNFRIQSPSGDRKSVV